jgi:mannose-6-phosphate isomerase-like protein (cupin superfamily)
MLTPVIVPLDSVPVTARADSPIAMTLARTLTHAEHGSNIMVGVSWMEPGEQSTVWSTEVDPPGDAHHVGPVHEFFYLVRGHCRIEWTEGELEFRPNDTLFLAPGWRYQIENVGDEQAMLIYAATPPLG